MFPVHKHRLRSRKNGIWDQKDRILQGLVVLDLFGVGGWEKILPKISCSTPECQKGVKTAALSIYMRCPVAEQPQKCQNASPRVQFQINRLHFGHASSWSVGVCNWYLFTSDGLTVLQCRIGPAIGTCFLGQPVWCVEQTCLSLNVVSVISALGTKISRLLCVLYAFPRARAELKCKLYLCKGAECACLFNLVVHTNLNAENTNLVWYREWHSNEWNLRRIVRFLQNATGTEEGNIMCIICWGIKSYAIYC